MLDDVDADRPLSACEKDAAEFTWASTVTACRRRVIMHPWWIPLCA
jgi:hypothetical protein